MGIGNPYKSIEKKIRKGIESLGNDVKRSITKAGDDIKRSVRSTGDGVKHEVTNAGNSLKHDIQGLGNIVKDEIEDVSKDALKDIEKVADKAIDELEDEIQAALEGVFALLASEGLRKGLDVLRKMERIGETALADASFSLDISAVGLEWNDLGGRVKEVREKVEGLVHKRPKLSRKYLLEVIEAVAPDRVALSLDVKLAALVVTTDDAGVGFASSVSTPAFLEASDEFFDAIGL